MTTATTKYAGFTLIELMVTVAIVGILAAVAYPNYSAYVIKASRESAQAELLRLAATQEKIYLNSNAYSMSVDNAYNGTNASTNGLGGADASLTSIYTFTTAPTTGTAIQTFTLTATPVAGKRQAADGTLTVAETGVRQLIKGSTITSW